MKGKTSSEVDIIGGADSIRMHHFIAEKSLVKEKEENDAFATVDGEECVTEKFSGIDSQAMTLESRILTPEGYQRPEAEEGSLLEFLRQYPVKEDGSPVLLYDGTLKWNQDAHVAVLELPIEAQDLQQCADSIMRIYAEYFLASGQPEKISFHFTNGFEAEYNKWRDGQRIKVEGNQVSWVPSATYDDSYETFVKYMRMVFSYAGTLSMWRQRDIHLPVAFSFDNSSNRIDNSMKSYYNLMV